MIEFRHVEKYFPNNPVFQDLNLTIGAGEFVSIVGPSGCGKSTFINLLVGADKPTGGEILVDNVRIDAMNEKILQLYRRKIGIVFQDYKLLAEKTAYDNVAYALQVCGVDDETIHARVPQVLEMVGLLNKQLHHPHQLSGGEQQRVAIARAMAHNPRLLIADEPTGNLDPDNSIEIMNILLKINELGTTVILTTHNPDMVDYVKRRVIVLEEGKVTHDVEKSTYTELLKRKHHTPA